MNQEQPNNDLFPHLNSPSTEAAISTHVHPAAVKTSTPAVAARIAQAAQETKAAQVYAASSSFQEVGQFCCWNARGG